MSDTRAVPAIAVHNVGKMYKVFPSRLTNFLNAVGLDRLSPWRRKRYKEFWALRDINLTVARGQRVGVIGCNGAGKSTLLKLITGNLAPTTGEIQVDGEVHALMTTGAGFHPEFTGRENIVASLVQQGLDRAAIATAVEEISEFTELAEFLDQPFKTYSGGMQARLTFATATTIQPDVLIIDEILGAGDGYFLSKSTERITRLVEDHNATVLLVSHSLDTITRFCEVALWIDRGRVQAQGPALEVVKAYEQFLRLRTERRLRAKNEAKRSRRANAGADEALTYSVHFVIRLVATGDQSAEVDVSTITLREGREEYESVRVGDAQDADPSRAAQLALHDTETWSPPAEADGTHYRSLSPSRPAGEAVFYLYSFLAGVQYSVALKYRVRGKSALTVEAWSQGHLVHGKTHEGSAEDWTVIEMAIPTPRQPDGPEPSPSSDGSGNSDSTDPDDSTTSNNGRSIKRWPGEGSITISRVVIHSGDGKPQGVFEAGRPLCLSMRVRAKQGGIHPLVPTAAVYRLDGVPVTRHRGKAFELTLDTGEESELRLDFGPLNLGDGNYVVSVGAFRQFDPARADLAKPYEIIDRSYEFEVVGNPPNMDAIFQHPGAWTLGAP